MNENIPDQHHIIICFCSMAMVETFYAGIEQAVPVHELPFGIDRELQRYVTDKPKIHKEAIPRI